MSWERMGECLEEQATWQQLQREQEEDRKGEDWSVTEAEIELMAETYWHEEQDPLEETR